MLIIASPWIYCSHVFHFPHDCNCLDHKSVDKNQQEPGHHRRSPDLLHLPMSSSILRVLLQLVFQLLQFLLKLLLNSSRLHLLVTRGPNSFVGMAPPSPQSSLRWPPPPPSPPTSSPFPSPRANLLTLHCAHAPPLLGTLALLLRRQAAYTRWWQCCAGRQTSPSGWSTWRGSSSACLPTSPLQQSACCKGAYSPAGRQKLKM